MASYCYSASEGCGVDEPMCCGEHHPTTATSQTAMGNYKVKLSE